MKNQKSNRKQNQKQGHGKKPAQSAHIRPDRLLFGFHAVHEAWLNPARAITALYITDQAMDGFEATILQARKAGINRPEPLKIGKDQLDKMLPPGAVHQGLAMDCELLEEIFLQDLLIRSREKTPSLFLMLDQVTDPHNVGAVLRSACAFGIDGVIMQSKHAPILSGVLAKTACGAVEHIPVAFETNLSRALEELKQAGYFVYGLDEHTKQSMKDITPAERSVLVLGAEGPGMRRLIKENCDQLVKLPTRPPIESLNVSNAAAIALYAFS